MTNKIKKEELNAIKDCIKVSVSWNASVNYKFNKEVNDILDRDGHQQNPIITPKYATKMAETVCNMIIDSDLSMKEKEFMLTSINYFINDAEIAEHHRSIDFEDRVEEIDLAVSSSRS